MILSPKKLYWYVTTELFCFLLYSVQVSAQAAGETAKILNPLGATNDLTAFIKLILDTLFPIASIIAVFFMIYAGFLMVVAGGSEEKLSKAKTTFMWTVIGIGILLGAKVLSAVICGTVNQLSTLGISCPTP